MVRHTVLAGLRSNNGRLRSDQPWWSTAVGRQRAPGRSDHPLLLNRNVRVAQLTSLKVDDIDFDYVVGRHDDHDPLPSVRGQPSRSTGKSWWLHRGSEPG